MPTCLTHGSYEGWECPSCAVGRATKEAASAGKALRQEADRLRSASADVDDKASMERFVDRQRADERAREAQAAAEELAERAAERHEEALEEHERRIRETVANQDELRANALVEKAGGLMEAGLIEEAIALLRQAVALDPASVAARHHLAGALAQGGQRAEARPQVDALIRLLERQPARVKHAAIKPGLEAAFAVGGGELASEFVRRVCEEQKDWEAAAEADQEAIGALEPALLTGVERAASERREREESYRAQRAEEDRQERRAKLEKRVRSERKEARDEITSGIINGLLFAAIAYALLGFGSCSYSCQWEGGDAGETLWQSFILIALPGATIAFAIVMTPFVKRAREARRRAQMAREELRADQ